MSDDAQTVRDAQEAILWAISGSQVNPIDKQEARAALDRLVAEVEEHRGRWNRGEQQVAGMVAQVAHLKAEVERLRRLEQDVETWRVRGEVDLAAEVERLQLERWRAFEKAGVPAEGSVADLVGHLERARIKQDEHLCSLLGRAVDAEREVERLTREKEEARDALDRYYTLAHDEGIRANRAQVERDEALKSLEGPDRFGRMWERCRDAEARVARLEAALRDALEDVWKVEKRASVDSTPDSRLRAREEEKAMLREARFRIDAVLAASAAAPTAPSREARLEAALREIRMQATRHRRASDERQYLVTDLEVIERRVDSALAAPAATGDGTRCVCDANLGLPCPDCTDTAEGGEWTCCGAPRTGGHLGTCDNSIMRGGGKWSSGAEGGEGA